MVTFVIGIPGSGKSTFIKNNFQDCIVIDLKTFQTKMMMNVDDVWKSYLDCKNALIDACKTGKDVVLEHTMLRKCRREMYVDAVKSIGDIPIHMIVINPSIDILEKRHKERGIFTCREHIMESVNILEIPEANEGYDYVTIIKI